MSEPGPSGQLAAAFVAAQGATTAASEALEAALEAALRRGRLAWPGVTAASEAFAAFLGERIPAEADVDAELVRRPVHELYLVHACLGGDAEAVRLLEAHYLAPLAGVLASQGLGADLAAEAVQQTRERLFINPTGQRPLLTAFNGRGELAGWLRVTATRLALRARRGESRSEELSDDLVTALLAPEADPELAYQRSLYRDQFRAAFAEAIAALTVRERNLLKQVVMYGASSDDLAALYQVHRATAARWAAKARERLADETKSRMLARLAIGRSEYDSIIRLIRSQLEVSFERLIDSDGKRR